MVVLVGIDEAGFGPILGPLTPLWEDVEAQYVRYKERIQEPNYWLDLKLRRLKRCL